MPEASLSVPVEGSSQGLVASRFTGTGMRKVLQFTVSVCGCGLSRADQHFLAEMMYVVKAQFNYSAGDEDVFKELLPTPASIASGVSAEQNPLLAGLRWMQVPITVNNMTHIFY